jgi:hypothetical protein
MTRLTDEQLGDLLGDTFTDHEHLADPGRAVSIATAPGRGQRRFGRAVLGAAAAVAVVAAGAMYLVSGGPNDWMPDAGPRTSRPSTLAGKPPLPPLQTDAGNRAEALRTAERVAAALPVYPGARETDAAGAPELSRWTATISGPVAYTETHQRWWTVTGTKAKVVARWYDAHAPARFRSEGVGGEGDGTTWVNTVDFYPRTRPALSPSGVSVEVQTLDTAHGVEVRAVVDSVWPPARPLASYVQDVTSIDVSIVTSHLNAPSRDSRRSFTVASPGRVLAVARVFDALEGYPTFIHSCPAITRYTTYRIVFHTPTGEVTARYMTSVCSMGMQVRRDGAVVPPTLAGADRVITALGIDD